MIYESFRRKNAMNAMFVVELEQSSEISRRCPRLLYLSDAPAILYLLTILKARGRLVSA
jgi:hypothetical protein